MSKCPFAEWRPINGGVGAGKMIGGPPKIVHHTTEGSSVEGAINALQRIASHFVVGRDAHGNYRIVQLTDTANGSRSLRNAPGGVQTNMDGALQIELVGFAAHPKDHKSLELVRKLCHWLETEHHVAHVWPNGYPKVAINGHDPGNHNRNAKNWDTLSGHYGHSQVPENTHWDPGYTKLEVDYIMSPLTPQELI